MTLNDEFVVKMPGKGGGNACDGSRKASALYSGKHRHESKKASRRIMQSMIVIDNGQWTIHRSTRRGACYRRDARIDNSQFTIDNYNR